jgi:3-hydroxymyristoyl/3-hydroxydecanoyl-(acyl carrier protein) dehydratase
MLGQVLFPIILNTQSADNQVVLTLRIPEDLAYLEGHFPGLPIVPGVVQLHWAVEYAKEYFKISGDFTHGSQIKFYNLMRPGDEVSLILEHSPGKDAIAYKYKNDENNFSAGRFVYGDKPSNAI